MIICNPRSLAFALLIAALPVGFALAGGGGGGGRGGAIGAGVGAAGMGSAGVGGGAPAGSVGGGPPAGLVGGGSPNSNNAAGNGAAGTGNPSLNAVGGGPGGNSTNTPGIPNARSNGGDIGGYGSSTGVAAPASAVTGGTSPEALSHQRPSTNDPTAPSAVQGIAEQAPFSPTGLARPGPDGVSTVIVAARPCGVAAHETDGTTTCIGIPNKSRNLSRHRRRAAAADLP
jgi:hypothetical protein